MRFDQVRGPYGHAAVIVSCYPRNRLEHPSIAVPGIFFWLEGEKACGVLLGRLPDLSGRGRFPKQDLADVAELPNRDAGDLERQGVLIDDHPFRPFAES